MKHDLSAEHKENGGGVGNQLVVLRVETSKLYRPSEPTSTILVRTSFFLRDVCYSLILCLRLLQITLITYMSYLNMSITLV